MTNVVVLLASVIAGGAAFLGAAALLRAPEVTQLSNALRWRAARRS